MDRIFIYLLLFICFTHHGLVLGAGSFDFLQGPCEVRSRGCWTDNVDRAIKGGIRFKSSNKEEMVKLCKAYAMMNGWTVFAVQGGKNKECFTGPDTSNYDFYGRSTGCSDGVGGNWAMSVYAMTCQSGYDYFTRRHLGCFKDKGGDNRLMAKRIDVDPYIDDDSAIIEICEAYARTNGYQYFGVESWTECYFSNDANLDYDKWGTSDGCVNGHGGSWAINVYQIRGKWLQNGRFIRGWVDANHCPPNSRRITSVDDCREAAATVTTFPFKRERTYGRLNNAPYGCLSHTDYISNGRMSFVWMNPDPKGIAMSDYALICETQDDEYDSYVGFCSDESGGNAGKRRFGDLQCESRCVSDPACTAFSFGFPYKNVPYYEKQCWTYTATGTVVGDGTPGQRCFIK